MIGDTVYDLNGAHENAISAIGVSYGFGTREVLAACHPEHLVDSVDELAEVLL
jgi:phosphoglycolate phosphatase